MSRSNQVLPERGGKDRKGRLPKDTRAEEWETRVRLAQEHMDKKSTRKKWKDYKDYYRGDWNESLMPVNRIFSFGRTMIPNVYFRAPRVSITAARPEFIWHAAVVEAVDNWLIRELMLKDTLKMSALDGYYAGIGPIKIGFDSEYGYRPEQAVDQDSGTITQAARSDGRRIEYRTNVKPGMPWALPVLPEDIVFPIGYRQHSSLPWLGHRIIRPLEDVQQDSKYDKAKTALLAGTRSLDVQNKRGFGFGEDNTPYVEIYEIRDLRTAKVYAVAEGLMLAEYDDPISLEGLCFEFIQFNQDPDYPWGIPDVKMIENQQLHLNTMKTQEKMHLSISLLKILIKKGILSPEQVNSLLSGNVGVLVEIDDDAIASAIHILQPHVPPDFQIQAKAVKDDMMETLGFGANQMGDFSPYHGKTAAESMIVNQSSELRNNERKDIVGDVLINIIRKWNQLIFKYWTSERVIEITGPNGSQYWIEYTGDQLVGEYHMHIDPESGMPITSGMKMEIADKLLKQYGGDPMIDQLKLRRMHLRRHDWLDPEASTLLLTGPQGMAQAMAQQRQPGPQHEGGGRGTSGPGPGGGAGRSVGGAQRGQVYNVDQMRRG